MDNSVRSGHSDHRVVIIGGGVIGVCCAYFLAKRGARVTVIERDQIGKGASFGNAGSIAPGHPPINKPGRIKQALKSLFDPLSPLYVAPRADPSLAMWLVAFSRACTERHLEFAMKVMAPLGHATREIFDDLIHREKLDCCFQPNGYYEIYLTERGLAAGKKEAAFIRRYGFAPDAISGDALREREPVINKRVLGGVFYPEAATLNPYRFVVELAKKAGHYGAQFRTNTEIVNFLGADGAVRGVRTSAGENIEADSILVSTGAYSVPLVKKLGIHLPLQPAKGYHRDRESAPGTPALRSACVLGENMVFCTPMDGFVRFAGTLEFSGVNHNIRRPRLEQLTNASKRYFDRGVETKEFQSEWCGLRPCISDGLPVIGPVAGHRGLFIATGHAMLGLTLGPVTGKLISECILDGRAGMDITALRLDRF